jgi:DNA-binding transcriptional regulator YdaS (Cro superfamily)
MLTMTVSGYPCQARLARGKMDDEREEGLLLAIKAAGGIRALARELGMSPQALSEWRRVPADRILQVEAVTKVRREKLRPDLYRKK